MEYQAWLLWYSLPVLEGILPEPYYTHYFRLVAGVSILQGSRLSIDDIHIAQDLLDNFYKPIIDIYGTVAIKIKMLQVTLGNTLSTHTRIPHTQSSIFLHAIYAHVYAICTYLGFAAAKMNTHILRHLPFHIWKWGPLRAYSCFAFEGQNEELKKYFHGTRNMSERVLTRNI